MRLKLIRGRDYSKYFDVYKDKNGKPYLNNSKRHISVTHFDGWTLVATSNKPIGIDVERIRKIDDALWEYLNIKRSNRFSFFKEWTKREAYIKRNNLNLGDIIKSYDSKGLTLFLYPYVISISA